MASFANNTSVGSHSSKSSGIPPDLQIVVIFMSLLAIGTAVYNGLIVTAFCRYRKLITPFNLYILNLSMMDILVAITVMPGYILRSLNMPLSPSLCWAVLYLNDFVLVGQCQGMLLLSLNRLWSLIFPVAYKNTATVRFTICVCSGWLIFWGVVVLPYRIIDRSYSKKSDFAPCHSNYAAQRAYATLIELGGFDAPVVLALIIYSYIFFQLFRRRIRKRRRTGFLATSMISRTDNYPTASMNPPETWDSMGHSRPAPRSAPVRDDVKHLQLFGLLAVCVLVCYMPLSIYYLLSDLIEGFYYPAVRHALSCIQYSACILNPLIYHANLGELQTSLRKMFKRS